MRHRTAGSAIVLTASAAAFGACVPRHLPPPPTPFLEKAYFSPASPLGKSLVFEGRPTAHFPISNRLTDENWQWNGGWQHAVSISEMFVVRMVDTTSQPVLTPSYHIGVNAQFINLKRKAPFSTTFWLWGLRTGIIHYSNGQHGCTYLGFARDTTLPERPCVVVNSAVAATRTTNKLDGDFSTTYIPVALNVRRARLIDAHDQMKWQWTAGLEFQAHPYSDKIPGAPNREQAAVYGQHEMTASAEWECRPERHSRVYRVGTEYTQRFGGGEKASLNRSAVQGSIVWDKWYGAGVFARANFGYDYYNINYQSRKTLFSFGMMWDLGRLDSLRSKNADPGHPEDDTTKAVRTCHPLRFWKRDAIP